MIASARGAQHIQRSLAFRVKRKARFMAWWLRWGWRPYGVYHRYAMDEAARQDPRKAVGALWDVLGPLQLEFLRAQGLRPEHTLLDVGCGSLRGGRHLMRYLEPGHYWGLDISPEILEAARRLVHSEGLASRQPHLHLTDGFTFQEVDGQKFDFVMAFAVFTDVPKNYVSECFANLHKVLSPNSVFFATYVPGTRYIPDFARIGFQYPLPLLQKIGQAHGYSVEPVDDFRHPRGHRMVRARATGTTAGVSRRTNGSLAPDVSTLEASREVDVS